MKRVGILGGTFDPPHNAHIAMAEAARERLGLDRVLFMPAPQPPHKVVKDLSSFADRVKMVELAIEDSDGFELSLLEQLRQGPSYTVELLRGFKERYDDDVFLILGADSVDELPSWQEPEALLGLATLVIFPRTGYSTKVPIEGDAAIVLFEDPVIDVSSTDIRRQFAAGNAVGNILPKAVAKFILDNSLYS